MRQEFELAYYNSAVHRFNHYTTRTPPNPLGTFPGTPTTNGINVTFKFHWVFFLVIFGSLARSLYLFIFSLSFIFSLWCDGTVKSTWWQVLLFLLIHTISGLPAEISWSFVFKNSEFYESRSLERILVYTYTIGKFGKILISYKVPSESPIPLSRAILRSFPPLVYYVINRFISFFS